MRQVPGWLGGPPGPEPDTRRDPLSLDTLAGRVRNVFAPHKHTAASFGEAQTCLC